MNPLWQNLFRSRGYEQTLAYFLSTVPAFNKLDKRELAFLENIVHVRSYQPDEMVFSQNDIGSGMYIIRSGKVLIYTLDEQGREREQALLETGDFFASVPAGGDVIDSAGEFDAQWAGHGAMLRPKEAKGKA